MRPTARLARAADWFPPLTGFQSTVRSRTSIGSGVQVPCRTVSVVDHLAIPVRDQERSRRFYETYFGFGARPARRYDDGVLMLYNAAGFALALGPGVEEIARPSWMHFGIGLPDRDAVLELRDRLVRDGVELVEEWDESEYVSVKCRDPDGYIIEAAWEPEQ